MGGEGGGYHRHGNTSSLQQHQSRGGGGVEGGGGGGILFSLGPVLTNEVQEGEDKERRDWFMGLSAVYYWFSLSLSLSKMCGNNIH